MKKLIAKISILTALICGTASASNTIQSFRVRDNSITSANIVDNSIVDNDLSNGSVTTLKIVDGAILNDDISDNSLTPIKLASDNAPVDEYCYTYESAFGNGEWQSCSGGGGTTPPFDDNDLAAGSVTTLQIADNDVQQGDISTTFYDEGVYEPIVTLAGAGTVPTYTYAQTMHWTRVGNRCFVNTLIFNLAGGTPGSGAGEINVSLPFAVSASAPIQNFQGRIVNSGGTFSNALGYFIAFPSATVVEIAYINFSTTANTNLTADDQNQAVRALAFSFSYEVD